MFVFFTNSCFIYLEEEQVLYRTKNHSPSPGLHHLHPTHDSATSKPTATSSLYPPEAKSFLPTIPSSNRRSTAPPSLPVAPMYSLPPHRQHSHYHHLHPHPEHLPHPEHPSPPARPVMRPPPSPAWGEAQSSSLPVWILNLCHDCWLRLVKVNCQDQDGDEWMVTRVTPGPTTCSTSCGRAPPAGLSAGQRVPAHRASTDPKTSRRPIVESTASCARPAAPSFRLSCPRRRAGCHQPRRGAETHRYGIS
jgi:hypothetical protein